MSESNDEKAIAVKPSNGTELKTYTNHRKSRNSLVRPLVVPAETKPQVVAEQPRPILDAKVNPQDIKLEIIVKLSDRHEVILSRTFESLLADVRDNTLRWTGIEEVHRLFSIADQTTVSKLNNALGPEKTRPVKKKTEGEDLLQGTLSDPFQGADKVPSDLDIHNDPNIGGVEKN